MTLVPGSTKAKRYYALYTFCFVLFVGALALAERAGLPKLYIGYIFLFATIAMYTGIGLASRTADIDEYFVAGRRIPAFFNGMATGADWMSAASFISMAGTLYLSGFEGLAYIMGWTGGYCLVAFFLAPYLRKFGQFTIPDFLGERYGGNAVRSLGVIAAVLCSFIYVVAQIYAVGIITSRFTGVDFGVGVFLGLAGILVCSFLGGMRAITWTQVAQYIVLVVAYLVPVTMLSLRHTHMPIPQIAYGEVLQRLTLREQQLASDPKELEVRAIFSQRAAAFDVRINTLPQSWGAGRQEAQYLVAKLKDTDASLLEIKTAERTLANYPPTPEAARRLWVTERDAALARSRAPVQDDVPFASSDSSANTEMRDLKRRNFLALVFCLMVGTAGLPHILVRYYTTTSVRETRSSVFWSIFAIVLLYICAPALAVLVKFDVIQNLVGLSYAHLPPWIGSWVGPDKAHPLISIVDVNHDGIVQFSEIAINSDIFMLAMPEISGLPYVVSGLVAAGGLAAALSTADGLLLTISSAFSNDVYSKMIKPHASSQRRVTLSKLIMLMVALLAALVTSLRPGDILQLVGAAFSIAASAFFPVLVAGIFWKRANRAGAIAAMCTGLGVCLYYMALTSPLITGRLGMEPMAKWWGIEPLSAGIFAVPAAFLALIVVSLLTTRPSPEVEALVERLRLP